MRTIRYELLYKAEKLHEKIIKKMKESGLTEEEIGHSLDHIWNEIKNNKEEFNYGKED